MGVRCSQKPTFPTHAPFPPELTSGAFGKSTVRDDDRGHPEDLEDRIVDAQALRLGSPAVHRKDTSLEERLADVGEPHHRSRLEDAHLVLDRHGRVARRDHHRAALVAALLFLPPELAHRLREQPLPRHVLASDGRPLEGAVADARRVFRLTALRPRVAEVRVRIDQLTHWGIPPSVAWSCDGPPPGQEQGLSVLAPAAGVRVGAALCRRLQALGVGGGGSRGAHCSSGRRGCGARRERALQLDPHLVVVRHEQLQLADPLACRFPSRPWHELAPRARRCRGRNRRPCTGAASRRRRRRRLKRAAGWSSKTSARSLSSASTTGAVLAPVRDYDSLAAHGAVALDLDMSHLPTPRSSSSRVGPERFALPHRAPTPRRRGGREAGPPMALLQRAAGTAFARRSRVHCARSASSASVGVRNRHRRAWRSSWLREAKVLAALSAVARCALVDATVAAAAFTSAASMSPATPTVGRASDCPRTGGLSAHRML